jgi:hemerythrin superfamily protein
MAEQDPSGEMDAIELLKADHRKVEALFEQYDAESSKSAKLRIAQKICKELDVHAKIEEKIFYPTSKAKAKEAEDDVNEGVVEHQGIKMLVKQISKMLASDEYFDSSVTVLKEYVKHHVKEEETEMFPKIQKSRVDLDALGERLAAAKARLTSASSPGSNPRRRAPAKKSAARKRRA